MCDTLLGVCFRLQRARCLVQIAMYVSGNRWGGVNTLTLRRPAISQASICGPIYWPHCLPTPRYQRLSRPHRSCVASQQILSLSLFCYSYYLRPVLIGEHFRLALHLFDACRAHIGCQRRVGNSFGLLQNTSLTTVN